MEPRAPYAANLTGARSDAVPAPERSLRDLALDAVARETCAILGEDTGYPWTVVRDERDATGKSGNAHPWSAARVLAQIMEDTGQPCIPRARPAS